MPATVQHAKNVTVADFTGTVTVANSTGGSVTAAATDLVRPSDWNATHPNTLQITGSEIASLFDFGRGLSSASGAGGVTAGINSVGYYEPFVPANTNSTLMAPGAGTWYFEPVCLPFALGSGRIGLLRALTNSSLFLNAASFASTVLGDVSQYQTINNMLALYKLGTSDSTTRLERIWSFDAQTSARWNRRVVEVVSTLRITVELIFGIINVIDASGNATTSKFSTSKSLDGTGTSDASTFGSSIGTNQLPYVTGSIWDMVPFATSIPAGRYWMAHCMYSTSSQEGTGAGSTAYTAGTMGSFGSRVMNLEFVGQAYKRLGLSVSDSSSVFEQFHGSYATTSALPPLNVATSDVRNLLTNHRLFWNYAQSSY